MFDGTFIIEKSIVTTETALNDRETKNKK